MAIRPDHIYDRETALAPCSIRRDVQPLMSIVSVGWAMNPKDLVAGMALAFGAYAAFSISDAFSKLLAGRIDPFEVAFSVS